MSFVSDLQARIGDTTPPSDWLVVTQDMINGFADVTGDHQWIHVDVERSKKESPYGTTIAHGLLVLSLIARLTGQNLPFATYGTGINYGCEKVRFSAPVKAGARIRAFQTLKSAEAYKHGAKIVVAVTVEVEDSKTPACYAEIVALIFP
jgi:acyl dehydratase